MATKSARKTEGDILDFHVQVTPAKPRRAANANTKEAAALGVSSTTEVVTPDRAREMRDTCNFDRQRKISAANVSRLSDEMKAGQFTPGTQIYICRLPDMTMLIVNGNHTLEAVHDSGAPQVLTVTIKDVESIEEAGRIYAVFDVHKARTWLDSLKAVSSPEDNITNASKLLSAVGVIETRFGLDRAPQSRIGRISRLPVYQEAGDTLFRAISGFGGDPGKFIRRAPVMAVALETARYQPSLAAEFWRSFAADEGLATGAPEKALLNYLRNNKLATAGGRGVTLQSRAAALAWNAAYRGDSVKCVRPEAMTGFYLLGTPLASGFRSN